MEIFVIVLGCAAVPILVIMAVWYVAGRRNPPIPLHERVYETVTRRFVVERRLIPVIDNPMSAKFLPEYEHKVEIAFNFDPNTWRKQDYDAMDRQADITEWFRGEFPQVPYSCWIVAETMGDSDMKKIISIVIATCDLTAATMTKMRWVN